MNKKIQKWLNLKMIKKIISNPLSQQQYKRLDSVFIEFNLYDAGKVWYLHETLAHMIENNLPNPIKRLKLIGKKSPTKFDFFLRYGKQKGLSLHAEQSQKRTNHFKNKIEYWTSKGFSLEESKNKVSQIQKNRSDKSPSSKKGARISRRTVEYWIKRGHSFEEARNIISKNQITNGLDWYIGRGFSKEDAEINFKNRINKWQNSLNSKSKEEKELINLKKSPTYSGCKARGLTDEEATIHVEKNRLHMQKINRMQFSKISDKMCEMVLKNIDKNNVYCNWLNKEYFINSIRIKPDLFIKDIGLVVEFYGDYWHANPKKFKKNDIVGKMKASDRWYYDKIREEKIKKIYKLTIIWEDEFRKNPEKIVQSIVKQIETMRNKK